jgi:glycosyltransferase involved in cell wall biosynthesis
MATIAIDARKYFDYGIGSYIQNLVSALSQMNTAHGFMMFASTDDMTKIYAPEGWKVNETTYGKYSVREITHLGRTARSMHVDLFHEPHYTLPSGLRRKSVVTIHDLIHLKMPQFFSLPQRTYARTMLRHAVRDAGAVIAVSQRTKDDIVDAFNVSPESISVVHHGIRSTFRRISDKSQIARFRSSRGLERPYVLFVGNIKPHKNVPRLLRAFSVVRGRYKDLELVFAGGSCLGDKALMEQAKQLGIASAIRDLLFIADDDLVCAYNAAEVVVLPSLYEGFGFPALEAMACGTPAIVSNAGSLAEVVGNAALVVDPLSSDSIAEAIQILLSDSVKKADLIAKGNAHVKKFTWKSTGEQTLKIYETVLERCAEN